MAAGILNCVGRTAKAIQARQENTHGHRLSFCYFLLQVEFVCLLFFRPNFPCSLFVHTSYTSLRKQSLRLAPRRWGRFVPFVLAKRLQRRGARKSGCFPRLVVPDTVCHFNSRVCKLTMPTVLPHLDDFL